MERRTAMRGAQGRGTTGRDRSAALPSPGCPWPTETPASEEVPLVGRRAQVVGTKVGDFEAHPLRVAEGIARLLERLLGGLHRDPAAPGLARGADARGDER